MSTHRNIGDIRRFMASNPTAFKPEIHRYMNCLQPEDLNLVGRVLLSVGAWTARRSVGQGSA